MQFKLFCVCVCICLQSFRGAARLAYGQHPEMEVKATESTNEKQHNDNVLPETSELPATITSNGQRRSLKNDVVIKYLNKNLN